MLTQFPASGRMTSSVWSWKFNPSLRKPVLMLNHAHSVRCYTSWRKMAWLRYHCIRILLNDLALLLRQVQVPSHPLPVVRSIDVHLKHYSIPYDPSSFCTGTDFFEVKPGNTVPVFSYTPGVSGLKFSTIASAFSRQVWCPRLPNPMGSMRKMLLSFDASRANLVQILLGGVGSQPYACPILADVIFEG